MRARCDTSICHILSTILVATLWTALARDARAQPPGFTVAMPEFAGTYTADSLLTRQITPQLLPGQYEIYAAYFHADVDSILGTVTCCASGCNTQEGSAPYHVSISGTPRCPSGWSARRPDDDTLIVADPSYLLFRYNGTPNHPCNNELDELATQVSTVQLVVGATFILECRWASPAAVTIMNPEVC